MKVVELESGQVHELPADVVTRDQTAGAVVPLAYRSREAVFYVSSSRWPHLAGLPLRVSGRS